MSDTAGFGFHTKNSFNSGNGLQAQPANQPVPFVGRLNPNHVARAFQDAKPVLYLNDKFYLYENGVYISDNADNVIARVVKDQCGDNFSINLLREVKASLQASRAIDSKQVDICDNLLNLKNGVLDLKSFELLAHWNAYYSTRQLACEYIPDSRCEKWDAFLKEILGDDGSKIDLIQEFFGYCLSRQTNQEKILWLHGRGANGKTVCTDVLEGLLGTENVSGVSLEMFRNPNYVARLATSMANISNESNSRSQVYESRLKELASGNLLTADHKYGHPFDFSNSCKLIF